MEASTMAATSELYKTIFLMVTNLEMNKYKWPTHYNAEDKSNCSYIVVGAGTAGSIIANRLSENPDDTVCLIEAGDDPRWETEYAEFFFFLTDTEMDWNLTSVASNDSTVTQYHKYQYMNLPAGKGLGGSSNLNHYYYSRGCGYDYDLWAKAAGDDSWNSTNLLPYFTKSERIESSNILNSNASIYHGKDGLVGITRESRTTTLKYLKAFQEIGHKTLIDINANEPKGYTLPLLHINDQGVRQSSAECFLATAKNRTNLLVMKNTRVTKVLINNDTKVAYGVECTVGNTNLTLYSTKEIIISAGVFNTPQLLMLSGVGPAKQLQSLGIPVKVDLPVGQTLIDQVAIIMAHILEPTNDTTPAQNPRDFPIPTFYGAGAIDKSQNRSDCYTINIISRNSPAAILQLASLLFEYSDDICNQLAAAGDGHEVMLSILHLTRTMSTGTVELQSSNPFDPPKINLNHLSNDTDLKNSALCVQDFINVVNSTYFQSVGGKTFHFNMTNCADFDKNTTQYWECYIRNLHTTSFHYSSTCPMGLVVDNRLRLKGLKGVRLGDASVMPNSVNGKINPAVAAIAEKLADMIKEDNK